MPTLSDTNVGGTEVHRFLEPGNIAQGVWSRKVQRTTMIGKRKECSEMIPFIQDKETSARNHGAVGDLVVV